MSPIHAVQGALEAFPSEIPSQKARNPAAPFVDEFVLQELQGGHGFDIGDGVILNGQTAVFSEHHAVHVQLKRAVPDVRLNLGIGDEVGRVEMGAEHRRDPCLVRDQVADVTQQERPGFRCESVVGPGQMRMLFEHLLHAHPDPSDGQVGEMGARAIPLGHGANVRSGRPQERCAGVIVYVTPIEFNSDLLAQIDMHWQVRHGRPNLRCARRCVP